LTCGAALASVLMAAALLCASAAQAAPAAGAGIEVSGNHLTTLGGTTVRLLGVNRSSGEYNCISQTAKTVFSGPTNAASIAAMTSWHINAVRLPLNEDCWLGINGVNPRLGGAQYRLRVKRYVDSLNAAGLYVILDLHWAAPGKILPNEQWPMADATHAPAFWRSVGSMFAADRAVLFDLYNEPFVSTWSCWENGCSTQFKDIAGQNVTYLTAGMQQLVDAVRSSGARNPLLLGGLGYAGDESQWAQYEPQDPDHQLVVSFHTYNSTACNNVACWNRELAPLAATTPVVTSEFGENDCNDSYALSYMNWADAHGVSYLGWAWDATDTGWSCSGGPALIVNYGGTPTAYGVGLQSHLAMLASASAASAARPRASARFVK
jgi:hypothetical protein